MVTVAAGLLLGCGDEEPAPSSAAPAGAAKVSEDEKRSEFAIAKAVCEEEGPEGVAKRTGESSENPTALATAYSEGEGFVVTDKPELQEAAYEGCLEGLTP